MNGRLIHFWYEVNNFEILDLLEESFKLSKDDNALGRQVPDIG